MAPGMMAATIGWARGNCIAAAGRGTSCRLHTASILRAFFDDFRRGRGISVGGALHGTSDENAGSEDGTDNDAHITLGAKGEFVIEYSLIQQGVGHRDNTEIQINGVQQARQRTPAIETGADGLNKTLRPQFIEGAPAAGDQATQMSGKAILAIMKKTVQVVNQEEVDGIQSQPLQAVLPRAHDSVIAIVKTVLEG